MNVPHGLYPVTITQTRYGGTYEGGAWVAVADGETLPDAAFGDDITCATWWAHWGGADDDVLFAVGDTPDAALKNLVGMVES